MEKRLLILLPVIKNKHLERSERLECSLSANSIGEIKEFINDFYVLSHSVFYKNPEFSWATVGSWKIFQLHQTLGRFSFISGHTFIGIHCQHATTNWLMYKQKLVIHTVVASSVCKPVMKFTAYKKSWKKSLTKKYLS